MSFGRLRLPGGIGIVMEGYCPSPYPHHPLACTLVRNARHNQRSIIITDRRGVIEDVRPLPATVEEMRTLIGGLK